MLNARCWIFLLTVYLICADPALSQSSSHAIRVSGSMPNYTGIIFLRYEIIPDETRTVAAEVRNGRFDFTLDVIRPVAAILNTPVTNSAEYLFLDTTNMNIAVRLDSSKSGSSLIQKISVKEVEGSATHTLFRSVEYNWSKIADSDLEPAAKADKLFLFFDSLVKIYPDNPVVLQAFLFSEMLSWQQASLIAGQFSGSTQSPPSSVSIGHFLKRLKRTEKGEVVEVFDQKNAKGEDRSGKIRSDKRIVLVDFWASWCRPCRAKHKELKALYAEFHEKDLEVISISLDENKEQWLKAVTADQLSWTNLSDLRGFDGRMARYYNIKFLPFNVVTDADGKILYKNISPSDLRRLLHDRLPD